MPKDQQEKESKKEAQKDVPLRPRRPTQRVTSRSTKVIENEKKNLRKKKLRSTVLDHNETPEEKLDHGEDRRSCKDAKKYETFSLTNDGEQIYFLRSGEKYTGLLRVTIKKSSCSKILFHKNEKNNKEQNASSTEDLAGTTGANDLASVEDQEQRSIEEVAENIQNENDSKIKESDHNDFLGEKVSPYEEISETDMDFTLEKEDLIIDNSHETNHYGQTGESYYGSNDFEEADALKVVYREEVEDLHILVGDTIHFVPQAKLIATCINEDANVVQGRRIINIIEEYSALNIIKPSSLSDHSSPENELKPALETTAGVDWNQQSTEQMFEDKVDSEEFEEEEERSNENNNENFNSPSQNDLIESQNCDINEATSDSLPHPETEYVSLETLAESANICGVCDILFEDITDLNEHQKNLGHYQCSIPECHNLIFRTLRDVTIHESQIHGTSFSLNASQLSSYLNANLSYLNQNSLNLCQTPPIMNMHLPTSLISTNKERDDSPTTTEDEINYSVYTDSKANEEMMPPLHIEQLPAPLQQLAEQVQRMPDSQAPCLPSGTSIISSRPAYFFESPTRSPVYRISGPQGMQYPSHITQLYSQYGPGPSRYPQISSPQMHPHLPQSTSHGQYQCNESIMSPSSSSGCSVSRQRFKRPMQQAMPSQQENNSTTKRRRMDVLMPDSNEDADCHVIAQQRRNDGLPVIQNVQGACLIQPANKNDSTIHLTDSLTLTVRPSGSKGSSALAQHQSASSSGSNQSDATAVANVLAARGITVTPASNKYKTSEQNRQQSSVQQQMPTTSQQSLNIPSLNLNSAISIVPSTSQRRQQEQGQFVIPQNRSNNTRISEIDRPPRPPTVDLTQDNTPQVAAVQRERSDLRTIQNSPAYRLMEHNPALPPGDRFMQGNVGIELAIPIVNLNDPNAVTRLMNMGINDYVPLSALNARVGGNYVFPIVNIEGAAGNPNVSNLAALGATSVVSLGTLRHLPNNG